MQYLFDEILGHMVYTVLDEAVDLDKAAVYAAGFKKLDKATQEYLISRLAQWMEEQDDDDR